MLSAVADYINQKVGGANAVYEKREAGDDVVYVDPKSIVDVCQALKLSDYDYNVLQVITGCDFPEENIIEVSYIINSFTKNHDEELILKVKLPRDNPEVETVEGVWKSANWQERECYDMVGVTFKNHSDFRRILCPDDWEGFPLRKDYQAAEKYKHMTIYPAEKMNNPDREFADKLKAEERAKKASDAPPPAQ